MRWFYLLISFVLVFAAAAIADPDVVPEIVNPPTISDAKLSPPSEAKKLSKKLSKSQPAASEPKAARMSAAEIRKKKDTYYKQCMKDWDAATHMTRTEWQRTCRRMTDERANFIVDQLGR